MNGETCLEKRGTVYYFRMKVPADLREHLRNQILVHLVHDGAVGIAPESLLERVPALEPGVE